MGIAMGQARPGAPCVGDQQRHNRTQTGRRVTRSATRAIAGIGRTAADSTRRRSQEGCSRSARSNWTNSDLDQDGPDLDDAASAGFGRTVLARVAESIQSINDGVKAVRNICSGLRPGVLDDLGLAAAIEWQASDFASRNACAAKSPFRPLICTWMVTGPRQHSASFRNV